MSEIKLPPTLKEALIDIYGSEDTLKNMRKTGVTDSGWHSYVWVKADEFATSWLNDTGYHVTEAEIQDDCLSYACTRKGTKYAIFFYAYGEKRTVQLDGEYCQKLQYTEIAAGRNVIVIYIHVEKTVEVDGNISYKVFSYGGEDNNIEPWLLENINGKPILNFYPRKELVDLLPRLMAAYNTSNLDILKAICAQGAGLDAHDSKGISLNDGFYSALMYAKEKHGKMKLAYIRFNDVVYSSVGYIEGYAYVGYSVNEENKIDKVTFYSLENPHEDLIITDDVVEHCEDDDVPALKAVDFLAPSETSRFSMRLVFENGETKRYDLKGDFGSDEVTKYQYKTMTDRIFANGRISKHIPKPEWTEWMYKSYAQRGQGVEFITGAAISTTELYHDSYPIEKFSYEKFDDVQVMQFDYCDDGFGMGHIYHLDPQNPYYLLDRNTMVAKTLPKEYQETPIIVYPSCGGYSPDGLIMVSTMGEIELQYHHNWHGCAGMWGWIDKDFNIEITPKYVYAHNFEDGMAMVCKGTWDKKVIDGRNQYWCENEQWGVIDTEENEIVPCIYDEVSGIERTNRLYLVHEGGWKDGHYSIYDVKEKKAILEMDFDYDPGYMFNSCFITENDILVFDIHEPGEEKDIIYAYDLHKQEYLVHGEPMEGRELNGETKVVVKNKETGEDIIVF